MAQAERAQADAYRNQIRRIQAALTQSTVRQEQQPAPFPSPSEAFRKACPGESKDNDSSMDDTAHSIQPPSVSFNLSRPFALQERSVNVPAGATFAIKATGASSCKARDDSTAKGDRQESGRSSLSLFAKTIVSADPFGDLVAQAWGSASGQTSPTALLGQTRRPVQQHHSPAEPLAGTVAVELGPQAHSSAVSVSSSSSELSLSAAPSANHDVHDAVWELSDPHQVEASPGNLQAAVKVKRQGSHSGCAESSSSVLETDHCRAYVNDTRKCVQAAPRNRGVEDAGNSECSREGSVSLRSAREAYDATNPSSMPNLERRRREPLRVASVLHGSTASSAATQTTTQGIASQNYHNNQSFCSESESSRGNEVVQYTAATQLSAAPQKQQQQQRLLSRIQLLDRALQSRHNAAAASRLLSLVKDDHHRPFFPAGPVNWAAVQELRERTVCELLGKPVRPRKAVVPQPARRASSAQLQCASRGTSVASSQEAPCATEDEARRPSWQENSVLTENACESKEESPRPTFAAYTTPSASRYFTEVESVASSVGRAAASPANVDQPTKQPTLQEVDEYAASRAAFQRESDAMRRAQERLSTHRRSSLDTT